MVASCTLEIVARMDNHEAFDKYLKESYIDIEKKGSKTVTRSKGAKIIALLEDDTSGTSDARFKHWVKSRGFQLLDYPTLGLKNVLCLPCKNKVIYS